MVREHVDEFGTASDGRLFRTYRGSIDLPSTLWQVLQKARPPAFTTAQAVSPLARKPYDFRHAGVSWRRLPFTRTRHSRVAGSRCRDFPLLAEGAA